MASKIEASVCEDEERAIYAAGFVRFFEVNSTRSDADRARLAASEARALVRLHRDAVQRDAAPKLKIEWFSDSACQVPIAEMTVGQAASTAGSDVDVPIDFDAMLGSVLRRALAHMELEPYWLVLQLAQVLRDTRKRAAEADALAEYPAILPGSPRGQR